jgi:hypothetical protein
LDHSVSATAGILANIHKMTDLLNLKLPQAGAVANTGLCACGLPPIKDGDVGAQLAENGYIDFIKMHRS